MRVGIVGFAGSGKSTLFQLLTGTHADPSKIHAGQVGVATLSDPRLDFLATLHKPKKITPATVEFLDTPGLLAGSHADNPQRLALIREGDALLIVLNGFAGGDPAAQLRVVSRRAALCRLSVVTSRVERLEASVKKPQTRSRASSEGARSRQGRAGGPRRGQDGRHARAVGRRQEAPSIVRPPDGQTPGRRAQHASKDSRFLLRCKPLAPRRWPSTPSSSSSSLSSSPTSERHS